MLLDPALTKAKSKDMKDMKQELNRAGRLKVLENDICLMILTTNFVQAKERKSALLPLYEKTGRIKIPAVK